MAQNATGALHQSRETLPERAWFEDLPRRSRARIKAATQSIESLTEFSSIELEEDDGDFISVVEVAGVQFLVSGDDAFWAGKYADESPRAKMDFLTAVQETVRGDRG